MDVRAAVAVEAGKPLSIETVSLDGPKEGECLVEIKATGICHTDEFTRSGEDPEGLFPAILGHEGAGVVVDVVRHLGARAPILGVCLGHQCVGQVYGGEVKRAEPTGTGR